MIRLGPRTIVTPQAKDFMRDLWVAKLKVQLETIQRYGTYSPYSTDAKREAGRYRYYLSDVGMDKVLTRLRALEYEILTVEEDYFLALTRPITMTIGNVVMSTEENKTTRQTEGRSYRIGAYLIEFTHEKLMRSATDINMTPVRNPLIPCRHPHMVRDPYRNPNDPTQLLGINPGVCWGNFSSVIAGAVEDADMPEILRIISMYLSRYDPASPLATLGTENAHIQSLLKTPDPLIDTGRALLAQIRHIAARA